MSLMLEREDLEKLTGKQRPQAIITALQKMGIPFGRRLDGWPVVSVQAALTYMGVEPETEEEFIID